MGDQETPELVLVEKNPEEAGGDTMQDSSSSSSMMEKEIVGISTLSLETSTTGSASYDSPCSKCGLCPPAGGSNNSSGSLKRASPCSPSSSSVLHDQQYQPKPKKLFLDTPTTTTDSSLSYSKNRNDLLRRCVSDPCKPPVAAPTSSVVGTTNQSPEHSVRGGCSVPNQNNLLRRCVSDPCKPPLAPTTHVGTGTTPLSPENAVKGSFSSSSSAKNLALAPSAVRRSIVDVTPPAIAHPTSSTSDKNDSEPDYESYVSVESSGETFRIHLNCQCGRACHLLVDGGDYYYKLM